MAPDQGVTPPPMRRGLLPHERWLARWVIKRQESRRTPAIEKMQANYGTEGIELLAAGWSTGMGAAIVLLVGILLLFVSGTHGSLGLAAFALIGVGAVSEMLPLVRARQAAKAGRVWRGERKFQR